VNDQLVIDGGGDLAKGNDYTTTVTGTLPEQCLGVACT
jgi:hypothetical protein